MFDYQAGEKYKLTLVMVGVAGIIAGMFFTLLLMPAPEMSNARKARAAAARMTRSMNDPDVTGRRGGGGGAMAPAEESSAGAANAASMPSAASMVDRAAAQQFMQNWLLRVWDLSAQTAVGNQEEAIKWMTPECAAAYRSNIWTADTAAKISQSGLQSQFHIKTMNVSDNLQDGSVVVTVRGDQVLQAPAGQKVKDINLEYMLKQTSEGIRVAGISEAATH